MNQSEVIAGPGYVDLELLDRDDTVMQLRARHLGHGTSGDGMRPRWFEVDIYERECDGMYIVYTQGKSRVEGERTYIRIAETMSAFEIVELLTVFHNGKQYVPRQSERALAQAAQWDNDVRDAYLNRRVA